MKKTLYPLIVLCVLIVATVVNIGMSYFNSVAMREKRMQGNISHAMISEMTQEETINIFMQIRALNYVRTIAGYLHIANVLSDTETSLVLAYVGEYDWDNVFAPTFTNVVGNFPSQANEIMTSRHTIELLGIANPQIGMKVPLSYRLFHSDTTTESVFILSGFYTDYIHLTGQDKTQIIFSTEAFNISAMGRVDRDLLSREKNVFFVVFADTENISGNIERLRRDFGLTENQITASPAFNDDYDFGSERLFIFSFSIPLYFITAVFVVILIIGNEVISAKKARGLVVPLTRNCSPMQPGRAKRNEK